MVILKWGNPNIQLDKINKLVSSMVYVTDSLGKKVKHETKYDYDKNGNLISAKQ